MSALSRATLRKSSLEASARKHARSLMTWVPEGYLGYRTTSGQAAQVLQPGIRLQVPFYHLVQHVDMRATPIPIDKLIVHTNDNISLALSGSFLFRVTDIQKACTTTASYLENAYSIVAAAIKSVMLQAKYDSATIVRDDTSEIIGKKIAVNLEEIGCTCEGFEIHTVEPASVEAEQMIQRKAMNEQEVVMKTEEAKALADAADALQLKKALTISKTTMMESEAISKSVKILAQSLVPDGRPLTVKDLRDGASLFLRVKEIELAGAERQFTSQTRVQPQDVSNKPKKPTSSGQRKKQNGPARLEASMAARQRVSNESERSKSHSLPRQLSQTVPAAFLKAPRDLKRRATL